MVKYIPARMSRRVGSLLHINRERRNTMATKKTTHSKKLHKAKKIGAVKPLGKVAAPTTTTPTENVSFNYGTIKYDY